MYDFVLNGGTIVNSGPDQTTDDSWGCDSITYAPDSTVTLYLAGRNLRDGERIVAWEARPEGVAFVMDQESRSSTLARIIVADDGIYVKKGLTIFIR